MPSQNFPTRQLGNNGPLVSAIGLGAMGIGAFYGETNDKESLEMLTTAANRGITFWDTSDAYGTSEDVLGQRSEIFLATKFGVWDPEAGDQKPCSKPSYIARALKLSLQKLQTDYIDLYYQHRVDPEVPVEVVLEALRPFVESGKIRWLGLSELSINTLKRAKAVKGIGEKVIAVQMEFSPFELEIERSGFVKAVDDAGVALVTYSPLGRGMATGRFKSPADFDETDSRKFMPRFLAENFPNNLKIVDELKKIADKYNATTGQITLAWILAENPNFIPIPGSRSPSRVEENAGDAEVKLTSEDVRAIRAVVNAAEVHGARYPEGYMPQGECIPLSEWKGEK